MRAVAVAMRTMLVNNAGITGLVGGHIYNGFVPSAVTADPAIVMGLLRGGLENVTPQDSLDIRYMVKAISGSGATAANVAEQICFVLHGATLTSVNGWRFYRIDAGESIEYLEQELKTQWFHCGWVFRIRGYREE